MRMLPGPMVALLLASTVLAGCFGLGGDDANPADSDEVENKAGLTVSAAIAHAQPEATAWREDAMLVGAQGEERSINTTIYTQQGIGAPPPDDPIVGDGRAPVWLVAFRSGSDFLLLSVDGDGRTKPVAQGGHHPLARPQAVLGAWQTDSPDALATALAQPDFGAVAQAADVVLSLMLRPLDPDAGTDSATKSLAEHPHWVIYATSQELSKVAIARIEAATGKYVDNGSGSAGEGQAVHEHAAFAVFIDGERLRFDHTDYDLEATQFPDAHLRTTGTSGGDVIHIEGMFADGKPDVTLAGFLRSLDVHFGPGVMRLDERGDHNGTLIADGDGKKWSVFLSQRDAEGQRGAFEEQWGDYTDILLRDGMRILLTYGSPLEMDDQEYARQQAAVPEPPRS